MDPELEMAPLAVTASGLLVVNAPVGLQVCWLVGLVVVAVTLWWRGRGGAPARGGGHDDDSNGGGGNGGGGGGARRRWPGPRLPTG